MSSPGFLDLPERLTKPRRRGITHVIDAGIPVRAVADLLATSGPNIDVWKFGWGSAYLDPGIADKVTLLADEAVLACPGGTLLEVAFRQDRVEEFLTWAVASGFPCVEVSRGAVAMTRAQKSDLISRAAQRFIVLAEVGSKDAADRVVPQEWAAEAAADLRAGATWVVTEGRESGTVGLYRADGSVKEDVIDAVVGAIGPDSVVFEAPRKDQQAFLIRRFGANVNLANIAPREVLAVEALRLGLRADTFDTAATAERLP